MGSVAGKLAALLEAAEAMGIEVREVPLGGAGGGGVCSFKDRRVLFVDTESDVSTRYAIAVRELAQIPEIEGIYLRPDVREDVERSRGPG